MDPVTGVKTKLLGATGTAEVEAVALYARAPKGIFASALDEPNGHTVVQPSVSSADVTVLDMPVLASLLFQNTPTGRNVEPDLKSFEIWEDVPPDVSSFSGCTGNTVCDMLGPTGMVYVRRRFVGSVPLQADGSARFVIPGGMPFVVHLADDAESTQGKLPRWQREAMTFVPGELVHQSMPRVFFNNLCGGCHGSLSGLPVDASLRPDFLTQASTVVSAPSTPGLNFAGLRTSPISGPPSSL